MEVGLIGEEVAAGYVPERVIALELANDQFDPGAVVVKAPEVERLQGEVGNQNLVVVTAELEQGQLLGQLFGLRSTNDDEAATTRPPSGLVTELGGLDAGAGFGVAQVSEPAFDGSGQPGDDDETRFASLEPFDQSAIVKPLVAANDYRPYFLGNFGEADFEKVDGAAGSMNIARSQFSVPEVSALAFKAQERMVGRSSALDGVVTDPSLLLLAVDDEHGRVDVQDESRWDSPMDREAVKKTVVQSAQPREDGRGDAQQEAPQGGCIGIAWQSSEILKDAILAEQLGCLDAVEPEENGIEQRQKHLADAVAVVALMESNIGGQRVLEPDPRQEAVQHIDAAVTRQRAGAKRNSKSTRALGHTVNLTLKVAFTVTPSHRFRLPTTAAQMKALLNESRRSQVKMTPNDSMPSADQLEEVFNSIDAVEVGMARDLLESSGMECFVFDASASQMLGSTAAITVRLMVRAEDAVEAREALKELGF